MAFGINDFRFRVAFRVVLIGLTMALLVYMVARPNMIFAAGLTGIIIITQLVELFRFASQTNRKLTRFLESVKYSDFISGFATDNKLGKSFKDLNTAFNEVLEAFRKARSEKEENWQYLNTVVQQVRTGILSFDAEGQLHLINANAKRFIGISNLKNINDLKDADPKLYHALVDVEPGKSTLHKVGNEFLLTIQATELRIRGNTVKLVTLQNIQTELQKQELEADYKYNVERRRITYEVYRADSVNRLNQLRDIDVSEDRMKLNLMAVRTILDNLNIKAPIDGQLSTSHWEVGQAVNTAQRLGQVDIVGSYKVRVPIDELYFPRISEGLKASTDYNGKTYNLVITYIYPTITAGRFEVDMDFDGETPQGIRRGQSLRMRIELGQSSEELLLTMGGFYKDTGGNWIFILDGENRAIRRDIKLGRKMGSEYFEVLEGLQPGDKVITSSYENFGNNEVLILN